MQPWQPSVLTASGAGCVQRDVIHSGYGRRSEGQGGWSSKATVAWEQTRSSTKRSDAWGASSWGHDQDDRGDDRDRAEQHREGHDGAEVRSEWRSEPPRQRPAWSRTLETFDADGGNSDTGVPQGPDSSMDASAP